MLFSLCSQTETFKEAKRNKVDYSNHYSNREEAENAEKKNKNKNEASLKMMNLASRDNESRWEERVVKLSEWGKEKTN